MDIFREFDDGGGRSDDDIEMKSERVQNEDREAETRCGPRCRVREADHDPKSYDQRNSPPGGGVKTETLEERSQSANHPFSSKTQKIPP